MICVSCLTTSLMQGYQPLGGISVDKQDEQQGGDCREGFYACKGVPWIAKTAPDSWPADQWPPEVRLPLQLLAERSHSRPADVLLWLQDVVPGFADVSAAFCKESIALTRRICKLLSKAVGEPESWLEGYLQDPFVALHNLHYAPVKSQPEKGILGLGDSTSLCACALVRNFEIGGLSSLANGRCPQRLWALHAAPLQGPWPSNPCRRQLAGSHRRRRCNHRQSWRPAAKVRFALAGEK